MFFRLGINTSQTENDANAVPARQQQQWPNAAPQQPQHNPSGSEEVKAAERANEQPEQQPSETMFPVQIMGRQTEGTNNGARKAEEEEKNRQTMQGGKEAEEEKEERQRQHRKVKNEKIEKK